MINDKKIIAIIPARGGSKGLPRKNIKVLSGKPLLAWPIEAAINSKYVDRVIVTTDDPEIAEIAKQFHADVPFLRPSELADDSAPTSGAILHAIEYCESEQDRYDYVLLLEPTSPLTEASDIDSAIEKLLQTEMTAIVGVSEVEESHPEYCVEISADDRIKPYQKKSFSAPKRRQELTPLYYLDGNLYLSEVKAYKEKLTFYHEKTLGYVGESWKSVEVDTLFDFMVVETIINNIDLFKKQ